MDGSDCGFKRIEEMANPSVSERLSELLRPVAETVTPAIEKWLDVAGAPAPLVEAMRYVTLNGGKRLRPAMVFFSAETVAEPDSWRADPSPAAVAVEMVHCYSLVHDDLPAMDDDTLRRGRPTAHVRFGEAMAILTGDALLTRAFEVLRRGLSAEAVVAELVAELAAGAGPAGMIAGQVADMGLCPVPPGDEGRRYIHMRKTAALIRAAARMGGICAGADAAQLRALGEFGEHVGLAFQITDDLLDATGAAEVVGKTPGKDAQAGKRSYAAELGVEAARRRADELTESACQAADALGPRAARLQQLAKCLAGRQH